MSAQNYIYDAETSFRNTGQQSLTESTSVGEFKLDKLVDVRASSQRNKLGAEGYKLVVHVEDIAFVTETDPDAVPPTTAETYTLRVLTGAEGEAGTRVGQLTPKDLGTFAIGLDAHTIENQDPDHAVLELMLDAEGTAPSIKFSAWVLPIK